MPQSALQIAINHSQGAFELDVSFEADGGLTAILGASGSGKTMLVNAIAGLVRPGRGRITLEGILLTDLPGGVFLPPHQRRIGYVFQDGRLFPHLTVRQNLTCGTWFASRRRAVDDFGRITRLLGLEALLDRSPERLSGGEKQRVAIGRALLSAPRLLIMDEPLASLDEPRKNEIMPFIERLRDEVRLPIIYVTHSTAEAARLATTVAVLQNGKLAAFGPVTDILRHSRVLPPSDHDEAGSVIDARVAAHDTAAGTTRLSTPGGTWIVPITDAPLGTALRLVVRARDVMIATDRPSGLSALNILEGKLASLQESMDGSLDAEVDCHGDRLTARITRVSAERLGLAPGRTVYAIVKALAFDRIGKVSRNAGD
jgi:molybdate transport system ATP-binding protein